MLNVRIAFAEDRATILRIHAAAFGSAQGAEIAALVQGLLDDETARPLYSLVAETGGDMVGHVLFTAVQIQPGNEKISAQILAPLAVMPRHRARASAAP